MEAHDIESAGGGDAAAGNDAAAGQAGGGRRRVTNRRRRASAQTFTPKAGDDLFEDESAANEEDARPSRRARRRGQSGGPSSAPSFAADYDAPLPTSDPVNVPDFGQDDEDEEETKKKKKKKKKGLFGLFSDTGPDLDEVSPHIKKLRRMYKNLDSPGFKVKDMVFIGAGHQELRATGHTDSGDGIQTLALLTVICFQTKSSDLHLEPKADCFEARVRVDGILVPIVRFPHKVANRVAGVIKVLCEIDFGRASKNVR